MKLKVEDPVDFLLMVFRVGVLVLGYIKRHQPKRIVKTTDLSRRGE